MENIFANCSFITGVVIRRKLCYLLATHDELMKEEYPHTKVFCKQDGEWGVFALEWIACSASVCYVPNECFIAVGGIGEVHSSTGHVSEKWPKDEDYIDHINDIIVREVRGINKKRAFAVGPGRRVYRRDNVNIWIRIDQTAQISKYDDLMDVGFESIDGFNEEDIYAVGWGGEIWHYDGKLWKQIDSPTSLGLFKVRCAGDGYVYACGQMGVLLRGRNEQWKIIEHEATEENLRGIEWFNEKLYVSTTESVYELKNDQLITIDFGNDVPSTCYHLSANDGIMWSIGAKDVMEFDGTKWSRIVRI